jgi:hypothetical protein
MNATDLVVIFVALECVGSLVWRVLDIYMRRRR